jgi:hypothetical protein
MNIWISVAVLLVAILCAWIIYAWLRRKQGTRDHGGRHRPTRITDPEQQGSVDTTSVTVGGKLYYVVTLGQPPSHTIHYVHGSNQVTIATYDVMPTHLCPVVVGHDIASRRYFLYFSLSGQDAIYEWAQATNVIRRVETTSGSLLEVLDMRVFGERIIVLGRTNVGLQLFQFDTESPVTPVSGTHMEGSGGHLEVIASYTSTICVVTHTHVGRNLHVFDNDARQFAHSAAMIGEITRIGSTVFFAASASIGSDTVLWHATLGGHPMLLDHRAPRDFVTHDNLLWFIDTPEAGRDVHRVLEITSANPGAPREVLLGPHHSRSRVYDIAWAQNCLWVLADGGDREIVLWRSTGLPGTLPLSESTGYAWQEPRSMIPADDGVAFLDGQARLSTVVRGRRTPFLPQTSPSSGAPAQQLHHVDDWIYFVAPAQGSRSALYGSSPK